MMNLPSILIGCVVLAAFIAIIAAQVRGHKSGKGGCGCGCEGCPGHDACHPQKR